MLALYGKKEVVYPLWEAQDMRKMEISLESALGKISAVTVSLYPPGIPLLGPGERVNSKIVEYLRFARDFTRRFPGFESDVHGLVKVKQPDGTIKYMLDCVRED